MKQIEERLEHLLKKPAVRLLYSLKEFLLLVVFYFTLMATPFGEPQLRITYESILLAPPVSSLSNKETLTQEYQDLVNARELVKVEITNTSTKPISDIDMQVRAYSVPAVSLFSNSSRLMDSAAELMEYKRRSPEIISFPNFKTLPPKAYVRILLWGDLLEGFWTDPIQVLSDADSVDISAAREVSGVPLFVADNLVFIGLLFASYLLLVGLRRLARKRA